MNEQYHLVLCLLLFTARACSEVLSAIPQRLTQRRLSNALVDGYNVAYVTTGPEFVAALADQALEVLRISAELVDVPFSVWNSSGFKLPIVVRRDIVIEGDPNSSPDSWPVINLHFVKATVLLAGNVTVTARYVVALNVRRNPTRNPGIDMFAPSLHGEASKLVGGPAAVSFGRCFPSAWQVMDFTGLQRPRDFPGKNEFRYKISQAGCANDTKAHPIKRCWADRTFAVDLASEGTDYDIVTDSSTPNNIVFWLRNTTLFCDDLVDEGCLQNKAPLVCYLEAERRQKGGDARDNSVMPPSVASPPSRAFNQDVIGSGGGRGDSSSGVSSSQQQRTAAGNVLTGAARVAVICGTVVAGTLLLLFAAWGVVTRQRRLRLVRCKMYTTYGGLANSRECADAGADAAGDSNDDSGGGLMEKRPTARVQRSRASGAAAGAPATPDSATTADHVAAKTAANKEHARGSPAAIKPTTTAADPGTAAGRNHRRHHQLGDVSDPSSVGHHPGDASVITPQTPPRADVVLGVDVLAVAYDGGEGCSESLSTTTTTFKGAEAAPSSGSGGSGGGKATAAVQLLPVVRGKGGFGRVVEGLYSGRRVAVKLLLSEGPWNGLQHQQDETTPEAFLKSFKQEVQVLSRCQHPNIVQLLAASVTPPRLCLVMELMDMSLERLMYDRDPNQPLMPLAKVLHIGIQIANALAYLHPTIVHRDLKPANVLLNNPTSDRPVVKLTDFGLSRLRLTVKSTLAPDAGTPQYMAPECFEIDNNRICHKADIYSLGVLLWEMLMGCRPWEGVGLVAIAYMVTYRGVRLPLNNMPGTAGRPPKLLNLVEECWNGDPDRRPAAAEVAKVLTLLAASADIAS